jgi:hypothetical protein
MPMKKVIFLFIFTTFVSVIFAETFDPKACYKRCMEVKDDKKLCNYICYEKRKTQYFMID